MDDVVARLATWLGERNPKALEGLAPGATDEQLAACEAAVGAKLPEGLRALLRWRNGNGPDCYASIIAGRMLLSTEHIASQQKMMNELAERGDFSSKDWWRTTWIPVLDKGSGDVTCIDPRGGFGGEPNQVIEFWHETPDRQILAPSFDGYLTAYVDVLEAGLWREDEDDTYVLENFENLEALLAKRFPGHPFRAIDMNGRRGKRPPPPPPPIAADASRPVKIYAATATFAVADSVKHPTFGVGVVQRVEQTKIDVQFGNELKTLVHAKTETKLEKPKRGDSTPGGRPPF